MGNDREAKRLWNTMKSIEHSGLSSAQKKREIEQAKRHHDRIAPTPVNPHGVITNVISGKMSVAEAKDKLGHE